MSGEAAGGWAQAAEIILRRTLGFHLTSFSTAEKTLAR